MVKFLITILFLCLTLNEQSASTNIDCKYDLWNFNVLKLTYHCDVNVDPRIIDHKSADITSIHGSHENLDTDANVAGFYISDKTVKFFPRGLEMFFENLKAIFIASCGLQEIHQSDLEPFSDLIYLSLKNNKIEVIEEGLFNFNPNLEAIILYESHIIHIDPDVFDNLSNLVNLWATNVDCINHDVENSRDNVERVIESAKSDCVNSEFLTLAEDFEVLQTDIILGNFENFKEKIENFENSLNNSKFYSFRPFNYQFATLKSEFYSSYQESSEDSVQVSTPEPHSNDPNSQDKDKSEDGNSSQCSILFDLKTSQGNFENSFVELKNSQIEQKASLNGIAALISNQCSKNDEKTTKLAITINSSQNITLNLLQDIKSTQESLKSSHNTLQTSQDAIKSSQDNLHSSMSDMEVILSDLKKSQNDFKDALMKVKNSQNEMRIAMNNIGSNGKNEELEDKLGKFDEKLANIEGQFGEFKMENAEKLEKIEKELLNTRHKISMNFDEKVKEIEKRIAKKLEEILEEKLGKFLKN